ncbi:hypothetical protein, partial [Pseudomonas sp. CCC2.2]|uniref:hypothetical protein n=1 Tax=Pseudomonas sp. CCC2.2 TaxID=3048605 RepID=UPI002B23790C
MSATKDEEPNDGASTIDASATKEVASSAMSRNGEKDSKTAVGPPLSPRWSGNASFSVTALYAYNPILEDELRFAAND